MLWSLSRFSVDSRDSSLGVLFGICGVIECCRTARAGTCVAFAIGCAIGAFNGGRESARGGGARASCNPGGGGI